MIRHILVVALFIAVVPLALFLAAPPVAAGELNVFKYIRGLKFYNFNEYEAGAAPEPAKNECVADPIFGSRICKDVEVGEFTEINPAIKTVRPVYSRWAADNADGSKYFVNHGELPPKSGKGQMTIYNSADNSVYSTPPLNTHESMEFRWDGTDPNKMYHRRNCSFYSFDITNNESTLLHDFTAEFPDCAQVMNDVEGDSSPDSRYWAFMVLGRYAHGSYPLIAIIVYDKEEDQITGVLDREKFAAHGGNADLLWDSYGYRPNMVDIAPSGDRVLALWPALRYPVDDNYSIAASDKVVVSSGLAAIQTPRSNARVSVGQKVVLFGCREEAAVLNNHNWDVAEIDSRNSLKLNIASSGLSDGQYTCASFRMALTGITVADGVATVTAGYPHQLKTGLKVTLSGSQHPALNGTKTVTAVLDETTFQFAAPGLSDEIRTEEGMYVVDGRWGAYLPDGNRDFPDSKPHDEIGNDGPHVYNLDFSNPVRVSNADTHSGWAWDLNGDPVFVCQINDRNWGNAAADSVGFTNIYTGEYTPVFYHSDLNYQGGWHFGRIYNREARGWAMVKQADGNPPQTNKLRDSLFFFELKPAGEQPRIWRAAKLNITHWRGNYDTEGHGGLTRDAQKFRYGGNWNQPSASAVNTYSVSLPNRWWEILNNGGGAIMLSAPQPRESSGSGSPRSPGPRLHSK